MNRKQMQYQSVKTWPKRIGRGHLLKYLSGDRITRNDAILAKCYECCGGDDHGVCTVSTCPLLPYSQYNKPSSPRTTSCGS